MTVVDVKRSVTYRVMLLSPSNETVCDRQNMLSHKSLSIYQALFKLSIMFFSGTKSATPQLAFPLAGQKCNKCSHVLFLGLLNVFLYLSAYT